MIAAALFGVLMLITIAFQMLGPTPDGSEPPPRSDDFALGYVVGRTYVVSWALMAVIWGPINVYGLIARRPWAARAAHKYWFFSLFSCCGTLPAVYGLISTTLPGFRALFERQDA